MANRRDEDIFVGQRLTRFREIMGIERKEMAGVLHITDDSLYRIEHGDKALSGTYAYVLAQEYHCDMNFLYGLTEWPGSVAGNPCSTPGDMARMLRCFAYYLESNGRE